MKRFAVFLMCIAVLGLAGCTNVPRVRGGYPVGEGKYRVSIHRSFQSPPERLNYAVNSFVIQRGGESYDVERAGFMNDYLITIPGSTPVDRNMKKVRVISKGRTTGLIVGIMAPLTFIGLLLGLTAAAAD